MIILETERLILREFTENDAFHFYQLNLDPDVMKYTGDQPFENVDAAANFLKYYDHYEKNGFGRWAVIHKTNLDFLGWCGLKYTLELNETDIRFRFFKENWNKGYATDAARTSIYHGFKTYGLNEIVGRVMKNNISSIRVLEKIGLLFSDFYNFDGNPGLKYKIGSPKYFNFGE